MTKNFLISVYVLVLFGLLFVYNATVVSAQQIYGSPYRFVLLQLGWVILGSIFFYFFYKSDYKKLYGVAKILFVLSLVFLTILGLNGLISTITNECRTFLVFNPCINGAYRWFYLNPPPLPEIPYLGILGFQPIELAKLAIVLFLSFRLTDVISGRIANKDPFFVYLFTTGLVAALVYLQPNLSGTFLVLAIGSLIYFVSGASLKNFLILIPILFLLGVLLILFSSYRRDRLMTFLEGGESTQDAGYHIRQIQIALGSGGLFGIGFGQSRQKYQYLPEISSDSIFAIIGEELGLVGTTAILGLFAYMLYLGVKISANVKDLLGKLLGIGVVSWIGMQFFVNVAAMLALIPLTGVPIPLISYGGSSMIFGLSGLGLLASVARTNHL